MPAPAIVVALLAPLLLPSPPSRAFQLPPTPASSSLPSPPRSPPASLPASSSPSHPPSTPPSLTRALRIRTARARSAETRDDDVCADGRRLEHAFGSGAHWSLCARLDDVHGLELRELRYRAPGDSERSVLHSLHLAQLLVHWHDEPRPERRLGGGTPTTRGLGADASASLDASSCAGTALAFAETPAATSERPAPDAPNDATPRLCVRERPIGLLAKYAQRPAVHAAGWELFTVAAQGVLTWRVGIELTEDGRIEPSVRLSGRVERHGDDPRFGTALDRPDAFATRATLLASWRLRLALDTPAPDHVEELDFVLAPDAGGRRPMQVRPLATEAFRRVAPERFRGWRVQDPTTGAGYHLDPLGNGRRWNVAGSTGGDWPRFELALTRARDCERHAEANAPSDPPCGGGLDDFVDGEALDGTDPVLWFSTTRLWTPRPEDRPFLSSVTLDFTLMPFDWTAASPFEETR